MSESNTPVVVDESPSQITVNATTATSELAKQLHELKLFIAKPATVIYHNS
jgi:hypothetical protein